MTTRIFRSDPLNRLGIDNEKFQANLLELAFKSPSEYFSIRKQLLTMMLEKIVKETHETIFEALTEGFEVGDGDDKVKLGGDGIAIFNAEFKPNIDQAEADKIAMDVVSGIAKIMREEVVNKILPPNIFDSALARAGKKAQLDV